MQFIDGLLEKMNIKGKATVLNISEPDHVRIDISGPDMGPVIGRRGDTLDAIQYLTSLVLNKNSEEHHRYRELPRQARREPGTPGPQDGGQGVKVPQDHDA